MGGGDPGGGTLAKSVSGLADTEADPGGGGGVAEDRAASVEAYLTA